MQPEIKNYLVYRLDTLTHSADYRPQKLQNPVSLIGAKGLAVKTPPAYYLYLDGRKIQHGLMFFVLILCSSWLAMKAVQVRVSDCIIDF